MGMYTAHLSNCIEVVDYIDYCHWRSQNTEQVSHIKGRLLGQAVILINCVPFQIENFSNRKEFAHRGSKFFPLKAAPFGMENHS